MCSESFQNEKKLKQHHSKSHSKSISKKFTCRICSAQFNTFYGLRKHKKESHMEMSRTKYSHSEVDMSEYSEDPNLLKEIETVKHFLTDEKFESSNKTVYNFRMKEFSITFLKDKMRFIYDELHCSVKINLAFGFVLQNIQDDSTFQYFYPANNNTVFETPKVLSDERDLHKILNSLEKNDLFEDLVRQRPDTKWKLHCLINVTFFLYHLTDIPLGCHQVQLPSILIQNRLVKCFVSDSRNRPFDDNLCMFRAVAYHLYGESEYQQQYVTLFEKFINITKQSTESFPGVEMGQLEVLEKIIECNIQLYSIYYEENVLLGELTRRSSKKYEKLINLVQYDNHICWTSDINQLLKKFRCDNCNQFFNRTFNLERHIKTCDELIKHRYPNGPYLLRTTIFDKLTELDISFDESLRLYSNLVVFDFESITVHDETLSDSYSVSWVGKHVPISVSMTSNLLSDAIFLCDPDPMRLTRSFLDKLLELSQQSSIQMRSMFESVFNDLDEKLNLITETLPENQPIDQIEVTSIPFLEAEANLEISEDDEIDYDVKIRNSELRKLSQIKEEVSKYCDDLPVFGFNSSRYDLNLIKEFLLKILLNERNCSPAVIRRSNSFIGMNFLGLQFLDILNFLGGSVSLDKFLKAYGMEEQKGFFPYEWFNSSEKLSYPSLPPINSFFSKLKNCNVLGKDFDDYQSLLDIGISEDVAQKKLKLRCQPKTAEENYEDLKIVWNTNGMQTFQDFLRYYNNKDVVPTLKALQKMVQFYHDRKVDMLNLGLTLPNLANRILHSSTSTKFFPFTKEDAHYDTYLRSWLTGGPSIIFTRYAKVDTTFIGRSQNICKAIVGIDASQLYPYSMTKSMPSGSYTKWEWSDSTEKFHPRRNTKSFFELMVTSYLQGTRPDCSIQTQFTHGKQKQFGPFFVDGYCAHCQTVFEAMGCFYHFHGCQDRTVRENTLEEGMKRRERTVRRCHYLEQQGLSVIEIWECQWREWTHTNQFGIRDFLRIHFPYCPPLSRNRLLQKILDGTLFGVVDCELQVPPHLETKFEKFPPIFKNCEVSRNDIGEHMMKFAEENDLLRKPRKMLISSMKLERGPVITPLLIFYLNEGVIINRIHFFLQYTAKTCFKPFVQSVVEARRQGDLNSQSTVVAETMKLIGNSSYGYQIMDRTRHTKTKYAIGPSVSKLVNNKFFKSFNELDDKIFEIDLQNSTVHHKEPLIVGFFILQYAKLTMLELVYNFFDRFCDPEKFEFLEMDTDSLYIAMSEKSIREIIKPNMKEVWNLLRSSDCKDTFQADNVGNFFPRECCTSHNKHDQRTPGLFKEEFRCTEMVALCSKTYCCFNEPHKNVKISCKGLNQCSLINDNPLEKYKSVLFDQEQIVTVNRGFRTVNSEKICTYEMRKKGLSYFYPKRIVDHDGIHTKPLKL